MAIRRPIALPLVLVAVVGAIVVGEAVDTRVATSRAASAVTATEPATGTAPDQAAVGGPGSGAAASSGDTAGSVPATGADDDAAAPPAGNPDAAGSGDAAGAAGGPTTPDLTLGAPAANAEATALSAAGVAASTRAVDGYAASTDATIAVAVRDTAHGQESVGAAGAEPIYSASVSKLYTVVSVLHRVDTGELTLTDDDRTDIEAALTRSDDNAMNALWEKFGGPASIEDTIGLAGLTDSAPPDDPSQWGETLISARDVVAVYDYVLTGLSPASRDLVLGALGAATPDGADGFDQSFGLLDPAQDAGADAKQGWMYYGSRLYLHSTGLVGTGDRFVVAVLTVGPTSAGTDAARTVVDKAVAAALEPLAAA